jgi:transcriptional regulator GlxA family with amidase domain
VAVKRLVRNSTVPIIDVPLETGYEHPASFTRAFKGVSPMRMRRMAQNSALMMQIEAGHS